VVNELSPADRGIAMVFQSYALYPHMTVYENMAFGLKLAKADSRSIDERVREAARILQLDQLLDRLPKQLSGGQRQRVAIGRAITRKPKVFLFDEPLSNLDAALRVQMRIEIAKLHHSLNATMIYVTHDQVEAMTLADRIAVLRDGDLMQFGSPLDLYHHPDNKFVGGFIGSPKMNFLPCDLAGAENGAVVVKTVGNTAVRTSSSPNGHEAGSGYTLGIRPEDLVAGGGQKGEAEIEGEVITVEQLGAESYVYLDLGQEEPLVVKAGGHFDAQPGARMRVGIPAGACYVFDSQERALDRPAYN
jgi:ABC-type sugar transport system ATPase subunit